MHLAGELKISERLVDRFSPPGPLLKAEGVELLVEDVASKLSSEVMVRPLTIDELERYRHDGVVKLPALVDHAEVSEMRSALTRQLDNPSRWQMRGTHRSDRCFGLEHEVLRSYLLDPILGENAARAMGSVTARMFFDHLFVFEPNTPLPNHYWHQDLPYWPVEGDHVVSFWLSLGSYTPETSALKFVRGTHQNAQFYRPNGFDGKPLDADVGERAALAIDATDQFHNSAVPAFHEHDDGTVLEFSYEPGDAVMFSARIVHSSGGNNSPVDQRMAYSVRFVGDDARMTLRRGVFQDPALLPDDDEHFAIGAPMRSRKWPLVYPWAR